MARRDMRDPEKLGESYLQLRERGMDIDMAVQAPTRPYVDGGHISSDPAHHHSKVDQTLGVLDDGGAS